MMRRRFILSDCYKVDRELEEEVVEEEGMESGELLE